MIKEKLRKFAADRNWDVYHSPKNLCMALSIETSELMEHFQWLTENESQIIMNDPEKASEIKDEMADVYLYLMRLADKLDVDLDYQALIKLKKNAVKYPVELSKDNAKKYTEFH